MGAGKEVEVVEVVVNYLCTILLSTTWNVSPDGDGSQSLVGALLKARSGDTILAAPGIYFPGTKRTDSFKLKKGLTLKGAGESSVLSGEIGNDGIEDNSYHVVIGAQNSTLVGFTITGGNANGQTIPTVKDAVKKANQWPPTQSRGRSRQSFSEPQVDAKGGGMRNDGIVMTIEDCLFEYNNAIYGGGMYNTNEANITITNCKFIRNSAKEGGGMYNYNLSSPTIDSCVINTNTASRGGGMMNRYASSPTITNSQFVTNHATVHGGAICNDYGASPQIQNVAIWQNTSDGDGGGIFTDDTASQFGKTVPRITSCNFMDNIAANNGGAIANYNKCSPAIELSTFAKNEAKSGGAISNRLGATAQITQCEFFAKTDTVESNKQ